MNVNFTHFSRILSLAVLLISGVVAGQATKFAITAITPSSPTAGSTFSVTVQSQNDSNVPTNVGIPTGFFFFTNGASDELDLGVLNGTIPANQNSVTVSGVLILNPRNGVTITATPDYSGEILADGTSAPFNVLGGATQLAFVGFPSTGGVGSPVSFSVQARRADNSLDTGYAGNITVAVASGPGTVTGTTMVSASAGVASFNNVNFSAAGTYTLSATASGLSQATSSVITISIVPISIFSNPITDANPSSANPYTNGQTLDSHITVSGIGRGSGLSASSATNRYSASNWTTAAAVDANDYFEFTLTPHAGYEINFSSFVYTGAVSAGSPSFAFRSSKDSYAANIGSPTAAGTTISLTGTPYQNVSGAVTFRFYGYGMTNSSTTYGINDFTFMGNVSCVVPTAFSVTGGGTYCASNPTGIAIGLSGSQVGISYQLKRNGSNVDAPVSGTGSAISFLSQTNAGTYTVVATNTGSGCGASLTMTGSALVSASAAPIAGSVSGGGGTVCSGTNSTPLTLSGHSGTIQWQSSSDNATFTDIIEASSASYNASNLTATTYFRAVLSNGVCTPVNTSSVVVNVSPASVAGSISGAATVCTGTNNTTLTLSGYTGSVQWQSSSDGVTFNNIGGATAATYNATNLTSTTHYRAVVTSGSCASATSASVTVTVSPASVAGNITGGGVTVCSGVNSTMLTLNGNIGNIQWQSSSDNSTFSDISDETGSTFTASNLTQTTYYRAVVTSSPCTSATTSGVVVTVNPAAVSGTISGGNTTVCSGSNNTVLTLSGSVGNTQWQSSSDNSTFSDILGETSNTFTAQNLTATTYYRAVVTSPPCTPATTSSVSVTVSPQAVAGSISGGGITVCAGSNNTVLTLSGSVGNIQWQSSSDNVTFTDVLGETAATFTAANIGATTYYRAVLTNSPCADATTAGVAITVGNTAVAGTINGGGISCGGSAMLTLTGYTGTIQWQSSVDDVTFGDIDGETSATFNPTVGTTVYYRAVVSNGGCTDISASVSVSGGTTTIWNGTAWSNGAPDVTKVAVFEGNYTASADINACSITVNSGVIIIPSGLDVSLNGALTVNGGSFTLENNANLLQSTNAVNTGNIIVKRNSSAIRRQDYTLWSSPVAGQNLLAFSPLTVVSPTSRFYQYNSSTNAYNSIASPGSVSFADAKGYLIRVANNHPTFPWIWNGQFSGVPHNGNYDFAMANNGEGFRFNCVGNPYPSPISMVAFVQANSGQITQTLYFWRETNSNTANNAYCSWSPAGGANGTFVSNGQESVTDPNGVLQTGQGFFVEATAGGTQVSFTNAMRTGNNANQFFRPASVAASPSDSESHRIWLNVTSAGGAFCQTAFGYMTGATNGYDLGVEGKFINDGDTELYSIVGADRLVIQGRALPFAPSDVVSLGFKAATAGNYSIAIDHVDGLFADGQPIYLKDNQTGAQHLLNDGAYNFTAEAGEFTSRFEVLYQGALATQNPELENQLTIISRDGAFEINSGNVPMDNVKVYDLRGRLVAEINDIGAAHVSFGAGEVNQVLIVKVTAEDGARVTRKVIN